MEISQVQKDDILRRVANLMAAYDKGLLGGKVMPEDANPGLAKNSAENCAYFTLPMALNYQRNSYTLWQSALQTYEDENTRDIFVPQLAAQMDIALLREKLMAYKLAIQPNKQPVIWQTLCATFTELFAGDVRNFFTAHNYSVAAMKGFVQGHKKQFPYLGGDKLLNYWLYVMMNRTDAVFPDSHLLTVSPDTHVLQASVKLGLITQEQADKSDGRRVTAEVWQALLVGSPWHSLDVHTPLWLWSRGKFSVTI